MVRVRGSGHSRGNGMNASDVRLSDRKGAPNWSGVIRLSQLTMKAAAVCEGCENFRTTSCGRRAACAILPLSSRELNHAELVDVVQRCACPIGNHEGLTP